MDGPARDINLLYIALHHITDNDYNNNNNNNSNNNVTHNITSNTDSTIQVFTS